MNNKEFMEGIIYLIERLNTRGRKYSYSFKTIDDRQMFIYCTFKETGVKRCFLTLGLVDCTLQLDNPPNPLGDEHYQELIDFVLTYAHTPIAEREAKKCVLKLKGQQAMYLGKKPSTFTEAFSVTSDKHKAYLYPTIEKATEEMEKAPHLALEIEEL